MYKGSDGSNVRSTQKLDSLYWHHLTFTLSETTGKYYINNTLAATNNNM